MTEVGAVLLAAGESSRMGQLKALLPWDGASLLEHQVRALAEGGCTDIVVVLGHRHGELSPVLQGRPNVRWVHNPDYLQGKTTSLKAGLRAISEAHSDFILILNVDQPRSARIVSQVIEHHSKGDHLVTIPCHQGKGGHPVAVTSTLLPELSEVTEEAEGMKAVMRRHAGSTHRLELSDPDLLLDLNTPEEYRKALAHRDPQPSDSPIT